jgi:hypothetical protein
MKPSNQLLQQAQNGKSVESHKIEIEEIEDKEFKLI